MAQFLKPEKKMICTLQETKRETWITQASKKGKGYVVEKTILGIKIFFINLARTILDIEIVSGANVHLSSLYFHPLIKY